MNQNIHTAARRLARAIFIDRYHEDLLSHENVCVGSGGILGYLLVGSLKGLFSHLNEEEARLRCRRWMREELRGFAGVSVGSLIAACMACRVDLESFTEFITTIPIAEIIRKDLARDLTGVVKGEVAGVFEGDSIIFIACTALHRACGNAAITFREVLDRFGSDLRILAVRVHDNAEMVFSPSSTPDLPVAAALAASMSIPGVFAPVMIEGVAYVDGGIRNQTGAGIFPVHKTLHVTPRCRSEYIENPRSGLSVVGSLMRILKANYASQLASQFAGNVHRTILVDSDTRSETSTISGGLFRVDRDRMIEMLEHGFEDVKHRSLCFWLMIFAATCGYPKRSDRKSSSSIRMKKLILCSSDVSSKR